ncbi:hypothetical protein QJS10_CPA10g01669 [Acorus calamus]|uniref:Uncharacterized protein n=1 Tax=Acorus calamus TaxID=4465 RepID=A0AAV9E584_ACOCL|nr:hypothetical protein QJS10_CPA10g01669 [Acorus calamus]
MWAINVEQQTAEYLAGIMGCSLQSAPPRHLGLPLVGKRLLRRDWIPLLDRFEKRLAGTSK